MTRYELSKKIEYSESALSKIFQGKSYFGLDPLVKISKLYNVSMDYLVFGKENENEAGLRKENEQLRLQLEQYKIRGENRFKIVPIHPYLWQMVFQGRELTDEPIVPLKPNYVTHKIKVINRLLNLPESLKLHSIRHTYATELMRIDTNRYSIKDLLGHKSVQTSEIYVHTDINTLHSTNNRLPELAFSSGSGRD